MNILRGSSSGTASRSRKTRLLLGLNRQATSASLPPGATRPAPFGLGTHRHTSGSKKYIRYVYDLTVKAGGVAPPVIEIVRMTHTRKDGTFIDKRAEGLVKAAEALALERSQDNCLTDETPSTPSTQQLNAAYIEGRMTTMEGVVTCLKDDVACLKEDVIGIKQGFEVLMKMNGVDHVTFEPIQCKSDASVPTPPQGLD